MANISNTKTKTIIIFFTAFFIISVCLLYGILAATGRISGEFGDSFGALNALFSGLAFLGVIYAVILQSDELALQRKELELTRNVLGEQQKEMEIQNFENTFFNLLRLRQQIIDSTTKIISSLPEKGVKVFDQCKIRYSEILNQHQTDDKLLLEVIDIVNEKFDQELGNYFSRYMRNICQVIKFIDSSNTQRDKNFYLKTLFSCMTEPEIILVLHHILGDEYKDIKECFEKYMFTPDINFEKGPFINLKKYYIYKCHQCDGSPPLTQD